MDFGLVGSMRDPWVNGWLNQLSHFFRVRGVSRDVGFSGLTLRQFAANWEFRPPSRWMDRGLDGDGWKDGQKSDCRR